jgi:pyridinium-3,5-biscarboxylic acid mononucleotide synthase
MTQKAIEALLNSVKAGEISIEEAQKIISSISYEPVGDYAKIDNHRELRVGYPECIYCESKSIAQVTGIIMHMNQASENILATRASKAMFDAIKDEIAHATYNEKGRVISIKNKEVETTESYIALVSAGTSDYKVIEEARETALMLGNRVKVITDVGVAGIHRLFNSLDDIRNAKVVVVIAGMEGALASVVGGLVDKPVIAVPTSVGYGANFGGVSALLSMLNSCASGVSVVNIDNGFGAAYSASIINHL